MDLKQLLEPLTAGQGPCGEDMTFSSEFDEIQEARRFDDPSLSQGEWVTAIKEADWSGAIRLCQDVLVNKSKDLRVAAWMAEAKGKVEGLSGLAEGYALLNGLCETFWEDIHPLPEGGDLEERVGVLDWLVNQTLRLIREVPLTNSRKGKFSLIDQESARSIAKNLERDPEMAQEIANSKPVTLEVFDAATKDTPIRYFVDGMNKAEQLKQVMISFKATLDQKMGDEAPSFTASLDLLDDVFRFYSRQAGVSSSKNPVEETAAIEDTDKNADGAAGENKGMFGKMMSFISRGGDSNDSAAVSKGPIRSREQAIRQLHEIAEFFRETEPHSPVAYLAQKAAKWGTMSLHEWLRAVVKDDAALLHMEELLGVESHMNSENMDGGYDNYNQE